MKIKTTAICVIALAIGILASSAASASDWGCKCILCLSNPGGPTQYSECRPPINKLERHLFNGGSFPSCNEAKVNGYDVQKGTERNFTCKEAYGKDWESAVRQVDIGGENENIVDEKYCRKFEGFKDVLRCRDDNESGQSYDCETVQVPKYSERDLKSRSKPHFIELTSPTGEKIGKRVWYKIKRKKKGIF